MCISELETPTDAQRMRDEAFLRSTRAEYGSPLADELERLSPGYKDADWYGKFTSLMRLNEEYAPKGASLLLDFGTVAWSKGEDGRLVLHNDRKACGLVFCGDSRLYSVEERDGVRLYSPKAYDGGFGNTPNQTAPDLSSLLADKSIPPHFRVALLALYTRQNIPMDVSASCRFAAGCHLELVERRWWADSIVSGDRIVGWSLVIRDETPPDVLLKHIGSLIRETDVSQSHRVRTKFPRAGIKRRTYHDSTKNLVTFVNEYLPSKGMYVLRSDAGKGESITWKRAYALFDERYPGTYSSPQSMSNAYYNAVKARREREGR